MGGKGLRRREKNFKAAHGGDGRLPPPPDPSSVDAVPSKLRRLMSFAGAAKQLDNHVKKNTGNGVDKGTLTGEGSNSEATGRNRKGSDQSLVAPQKQNGEVPHPSSSEKKRKRKKRNKKVDDLRFEAVGEPGAAASKRKERKKQLFEERKKKHKKASVEEDINFRGHEEIKFGEVVKAPPKLSAIPKAFKKTHDASQERIRLQAIEAYRKRKGWASRPGVQLSPPVTTRPLL